MKKSVLIIILVVIAVVLIGAGWYINNLNRVVTMDEEVKNAWSEVENQLQRRNDLIPNLVSTVKGYAKQEQTIFIKIAEARAKLAGTMKDSASVNQKVEAANEMQSALSRLLVIVENYPQLKSDANFQSLQDELAGTENRVSVARTRYNREARAFNSYVRSVFGGMFAKKRGLEELKVYFQAEETAKKAPKVEF